MADNLPGTPESFSDDDDTDTSELDELYGSDDNENSDSSEDDCPFSSPFGDLEVENQPENELHDAEEEEAEDATTSTQRLTREELKERMCAFSFTSTIIRNHTISENENIMSDFRDAEIFLIDGDSLLFEFAFEERTLSWLGGGQYLHLAYLVERFLQLFMQKGGKFHVVFFKGMEKMWCFNTAFALARQCIILHLQHNTNLTIVTHVDSCWSAEWKQYIDTHRPAFLLLSEVAWETKKAQKIPLLFVEDGFLFQSVLVNTLCLDLNCVYIGDIDFKASGAFGVYVQPTLRLKRSFQQYQNRLESVWELLKKEREDGFERNFVQSCYFLNCEMVQELSLDTPVPGGLRATVYVMSVADLILSAIKDDRFGEEAWPLFFGVVKVFILHLVLLKTLPLQFRAQPNRKNDIKKFTICDGTVDLQEELKLITQELRLRLYRSLDLLKQSDFQVGEHEYNDGLSFIADILDGRLFLSLLTECLRSCCEGREVSVPSDILQETECIWRVVMGLVSSKQKQTEEKAKHLVNTPLSPMFTFSVIVSSAGVEKCQEALPQSDKFEGLMPLKNPLVENFAGETRVTLKSLELNETEKEQLIISGRDFDEKYHWHSLKPLSDDYDRTKQNFGDKLDEDPRIRRKQLKSRQKYARYMQLYGLSVEGGKDRAKVIIANKEAVDTTTSKAKREKHTEAKACKKGKQKQPKKADIIKAENLRKKNEQKEKEEEERWLNCSKNFKTMSNFQAILNGIDVFNSGCDVASVRATTLMKKVETCFQAWKSIRKSREQKPESDLTAVIQLFDTVQCLVDGYSSELNEGNKKKLAKYMIKLGFEDVALSIFSAIKDSNKSLEGSNLSVGMTSARFQLEKMGHLLRRDVRTDPDPRVDGFIPDTWQREMLDAVDNNESALIVAPTSSGKTYVSYYCMEKVIRESDDGIVVYVSPTKALVNQVAATVYARFRLKKLPPGRSVYGVFTRDFRQNTLNSQILITVPQCLEILLLSPHRQDWASRIKYVIFDEVHCLGTEIGAEVWEHLLLLIRCPLLALSATIGNPRDLHRWLQAAQDFRKLQDEASGVKLRNSYNVRFITHSERFSDLEKSIYLPKPENGCFDTEEQQYTEKCDYSETDEFYHVHPCAVLSGKQLATKGFPSDLTLTPGECVQLYDAMVRLGQDESVSALEPEVYFCKTVFITKADARRYEQDLKKKLKIWVDKGRLQQVDHIFSTLGSRLEDKIAANTSEWEAKLFDGSNHTDFLMVNFLKLIEQLEAQGKLPALFFSFSRRNCEESVQEAVIMLRERERDIREGPLKSHLEQLKAKQERLLKARKNDRDKPKTKITREDLEAKANDPDFSMLTEPLPSCSFANGHVVTKEDQRKVLGRIYKDNRWYHLFMAGIRRGLSFHHAGLNAKYRAATEVLFRSRYLQVVVATGTLALGIHMPCKTVVFLGDNIYLNSLNFRQMSGRSGRRGFDPIGNVVFFGVPFQKVRRLLNAEVPSIHGNFPLTVSLVLRLMLLTAKSAHKQDKVSQEAEDKAMSLLEHPFLSYSEPNIKNQVRHHFLFSLEFLVRQGFLDLKGVPQEMSGLATHLHYHEPSNFIFVYFLQKGLFHRLCNQYSGKVTEEVMREIVLVLSHLFARRKLRRSQVHGKKFSSSKVILEDLPAPFQEALQEYNARTVDVFGLYLKKLGDKIKEEHGEEKKLPFSGIVFPDSTSFRDSGTETNTKDSIIEALKKSSLPYSAYSAFAALSGNTDSDLKKHKAPQVLVKTIRSEVFTDSQILPVLPETDFVGRKILLNAYALDFFKHGSQRAIYEENGLKHGDVYQALKDVHLTIQAISVSLEELGPEGRVLGAEEAAATPPNVTESSVDPVINAFKKLASEYRSRFNKAFGINENSY